MTAQPNQLFSRAEIHALYGGSMQSYLPMKGGAVVCGCFDPSLNSRAPCEIDVGDGPIVIASAERLVASHATIPVFLKEGKNRWRFVGPYRALHLSSSPEDLRAHADRRSDAIAVLFLEEVDVEPQSAVQDLELLTAVEGRALLRVHIARERKPSLVAAKKRLVLAEKGALVCEGCGLRSTELPPDIGDACFEAHHRAPLATVDHAVVTRLDDLALLCANCHRMIHRRQPLMTVQALGQALNGRKD